MTVKELKDKINLQLLSGIRNLDNEVNGCYISDLLSLAMSHINEKNVWVTVQTNINIVAVAVLTEATCIVVTEGQKVEQATIDKADIQHVTILSTDLSSYDFACRFKDLEL